jgi:RNase P/RNase MRP subunit p30
MDINLFDENVEFVIKTCRDKFVVVKGGNDKVNRMAVSSKKADILLDPHLGYRKDFMHNRNSGLNQVLCKLAKDNSVAIGFSFSNILYSKDYREFGRIIQNIKLCRKYKIKMVVGNFAKSKNDVREIKDVYSLFKVLGMTGKELKDSSEFLEKRLDYKRRYVSKGVSKLYK